MSITTNNPQALGWKYPNVGGISTNSGVVTGWPDSLPELTQDLVDSIEAEWTASEGHKENRRKSYPRLEEQLDMQYHDLVDGTTKWKDAIAKVKSDNPKA
tara:strand:- start:219 stop:518 length:300 start_codon:yes stop_codon:yes gene_type:complete